jgi:hypothetical protein
MIIFIGIYHYPPNILNNAKYRQCTPLLYRHLLDKAKCVRYVRVAVYQGNSLHAHYVPFGKENFGNQVNQGSTIS